MSVNNAFGTLKYEWTYNGIILSGAINRTIFDLPKGTYHAKVTDANQCVYESDVVITSPAPIKPQLQIPPDGQISCPGFSDGKLQSIPINGYGSYRYKWDHNSSVTTSLVQNLSKGSYNIIVTDDYGCSASDNIMITDPSEMKFHFFKADYNGFDVSCFGRSDGEVRVKIENGQGREEAFKFLWSNNAKTRDIKSLTEGVYSVSVTDEKGCVADSTVTVKGPPLLKSTIGHVYNFNGYDLRCYGDSNGEVNVKVKGGTGVYAYQWSNGSTLSNTSGLVSGYYSVKVIDSNGCENSSQVKVTEPERVSIDLDFVNPVSCFGSADGVVIVRGQGGVVPYTFSDDYNVWQLSEEFSCLRR